MKISLKWIYLLNLWLDSQQSSTAIPFGQSKELTMFWYIDPIFVNSHLTEVDFIAKIETFLEQMHGYSLDMSRYIIVTGLKNVKILVTLTPFSRSKSCL